MMWGILITALVFGSLGCDTEAQKKQRQEQALHDAADQKFSAKIKVLLKAGANANEKDDEGRTLLHLAAVKNFSATAEALLKAGANTNEKDNTGRTPLHDAARENAVA
ncbi:MAG: ankyrin repeat domain-containing protein, partial [Gemmatimonadota bacterium]|nr:ankyrin repeat domain-containing protein [Gemmatimonadota bacterium]